MVYFMQSVDGGPVKIGFSNSVEVRLKQLEAIYAKPLALLRVIQGGRIEEHDIHSKFAHLRIGRTEQFRPEPELLEFIGRPLFVSAGPVVEAMTSHSTRTIALRVTHEYADWLIRAAKHDRVAVASFLDRAGADRARAIGFVEPPPERIP